jgi:hypothetical protein
MVFLNTTSTPQVDMDELKRYMGRELLGDLKPILESQIIQFPNIVGVMSEEEHRRSLASTAADPITTKPSDQVPEVDEHRGGLEVAASRPIEGHEEPLPSLELDKIDNLSQPTT